MQNPCFSSAAKHAAEVKQHGITVIKLPEEALERARSIFEHISDEVLAEKIVVNAFEPLDSWSWPLPHWYRRFVLPHLPVQKLSFDVGMQQDSDDESDDEEVKSLRYANAAAFETLKEMTDDEEWYGQLTSSDEEADEE
eukprot:TRINITY_DN15411_c0_g2_i1.p2 TRINITY_DN15411_c0_g2~~TRINITY_DN15411_c0_g2_i1.p2  ORF type:complete len:139 (-),score=41.89 TRINITY_DN15411_c0_g2_i1:1119-1535(-)